MMRKPTPAYYLTLHGRISRSEYWLYFQLPFFLYNLIALFVLPADAGAALTLIVRLPAIIIAFIACVRRFHDRDKSGWWILIALIPIWLFVELGFLKGTTGPNKYGDDPLEALI